jgi:hypothetical protein
VEQVEQEILSILWRNIRLVARPDFEETGTWMVKPGCLEKAAKEIAEKFNR